MAMGLLGALLGVFWFRANKARQQQIADQTVMLDESAQLPAGGVELFVSEFGIPVDSEVRYVLRVQSGGPVKTELFARREWQAMNLGEPFKPVHDGSCSGVIGGERESVSVTLPAGEYVLAVGVPDADHPAVPAGMVPQDADVRMELESRPLASKPR